MKAKFLSLLVGLACICISGIAQVPKGFNYQAIARDGTGKELTNLTLPVRLTIQTTISGGTVVYEETFNSVTTNSFGLFNLVVGSGTPTTGTFAAINWNQTLFLKTSVYYPAVWIVMGTSQLWSVPYAMVADKANGVNSGTKLSVTGTNDAGTDALFEVKRADGQTVFAVYPNAVNVYVPKSSYKGVKGGFAVGGYDGSKAGSPGTIQDYLRVTPDSVRIYVDPNPTAAKGVKGGFAVGGYDESKGINSMYFNLTPNGNVTTVASSPQILWYPTKNAFLAGNIHIGHIDSVGMYSTSLGYQSVAMGKYSQAFGFKTKALGDYSTAIGKNSVAGARSGDRLTSLASNSFALGNGTRATGDDSYAFGSGARATGIKSFAFGSVGLDDAGNPTAQQTTASGDYSTAVGMGAQATARGAMALGVGALSSGTYSGNLGYYSTAGGSYSTAIGYKSNAAGTASLTFGRNSYSVGSYSVAIGDSAKTQASYAAALGNYAKAKGTASVAIGYNSQTTASGNYSGAFGYFAKSAALYSVAIGFNAQTTSTGPGAGAFGYNSIANGQYSVAVGPSAVTGATANYAGSFGYAAAANGPYSVAVGPSATTGASSNYAGSFGYSAAANGVNSVAVGYGANTGASATDASAFGKQASATGATSMALGPNAIASGATSVSIGYSSDATNSNSVAMGYDAQSTGQYSMALGYNPTASNTYSTAIGYQAYSSGQYATALGNSRAYGTKSLALGSYYSYTYYRRVFNKFGGWLLIPVTINVPNTSTRDYSIAVGNGNTSEDGGIALGQNNRALSNGSVAIGHSNEADTSFSFAAGYNNVSQGYNAFALGENVTAQASNSLVIGAYNIQSAGYNKYEWVDTDPLFVIGNGDGTTPSNALVTYKNGTTQIDAGDATYGLNATNLCSTKNMTVYGLSSYAQNTYTSNSNSIIGAQLKATNTGTGTTMGTYSYASSTNTAASWVMSGEFVSYGYGGINYGLYSYAKNYAGATGDTYSGYFIGSDLGSGTYKGVYADVRSGASIDLAEYIYDSNKDTKPADVVVADPAKKESVIKSTKPYQTGILGVISTKPHMTMGMDLITDSTGKPKPNVSAARLALSGRVPVNVCGENGDIKPGDYLTSSSKPGVAMKWSLLDVNSAMDFDGLKKILAENENRRGAIIGKAVESFSGSGIGKIMVLISLQ